MMNLCAYKTMKEFTRIICPRNNLRCFFTHTTRLSDSAKSELTGASSEKREMIIKFWENFFDGKIDFEKSLKEDLKPTDPNYWPRWLIIIAIDPKQMPKFEEEALERFKNRDRRTYLELKDFREHHGLDKLKINETIDDWDFEGKKYYEPGYFDDLYEELKDRYPF